MKHTSLSPRLFSPVTTCGHGVGAGALGSTSLMVSEECSVSSIKISTKMTSLRVTLGSEHTVCVCV